jgi:transcription termination/antitermination protein NusG
MAQSVDGYKPRKVKQPAPKPLSWAERYPLSWYCIGCSSAAEARVALRLKKYCEMLGWEHLFDTYLIPMETVMTITAGGERSLKRERLFAGYLLVKIRLTPSMNDLIISTSGVQSILGDRTGINPTIIPQSQINRVIAMMIEAEQSESQIRRRPKLEPGTKVVIVHGSFANFSGEVLEQVGSQVFVKVNIFGRPTRAGFNQEIVIPESLMLTSNVSITH